MLNRKTYFITALLVALMLSLVGGVVGVKAQDDDSAALSITGMVENEMAWTEEEVRAMEAMEAIYTNKDGEEKAYTGVALNMLLDEAGVQDNATVIVFVGNDGYEASLTVEEIQGCVDCIVAFRDSMGFNMVLPGFPSNVQVKGVVEIRVQYGVGNVLSITGMVENEIAWAEGELRAMETIEAVYTNRDGEEETYTGVALTMLLDEAVVYDDATEIVFIATDGYEASLTLEEIQNCTDCIVTFRETGGFNMVLPGFPGNVQVNGVVEIRAQKPALSITGMVENEIAWTEEEIHTMESMEAIYTNRDGEEETYTGVALTMLLDEAEVQDNAMEVVFIATDGYEASLTLEEIQNCTDCIVAFRDSGGFSMVLPGFPSNVQVKGVIEIKVQ